MRENSSNVNDEIVMRRLGAGANNKVVETMWWRPKLLVFFMRGHGANGNSAKIATSHIEMNKEIRWDSVYP